MPSALEKKIVGDAEIQLLDLVLEASGKVGDGAGHAAPD
jgi:hypothetical protein